ncbi:hypothetical protein JCM10908_006689 [Rhodotorula pacifica]|uniref:tRNA 1-methyladenosine methyltransferase subunit GCD14 n=1 Tax=Rhodotorula pacifica TaxID=1495444 RepID=UPI00317793FC
MGFDRAGEVQYGDWVIVYHSRTQLTSELVTRDKEIQSRYGHFRHADMVGKPWGTKLASSNGRGFVFLLKPTPELWTQALPHRTQILYLPDIAFITSHLDVKAGTQVIEAGTGSGSFSHSLARTVGKEGKVHSFEYHQERYGKAKIEFKEHALSDIITVKHRDVYKDGFELENEVDAIFLDLPAPWEALEHAKKAMRRDRQARICCFSPCIEQVIRTCSALADLGFSDITMYETLTRTHDPTPIVAPDIGTAITRIEEVETKKERRREGQIQEAARKREEKQRQREAEAVAELSAPQADAGGIAQVDSTTPSKREAVAENGGPPAKRAKHTTASSRDVTGGAVAGQDSSRAGPTSSTPDGDTSLPRPVVDKSAEGRRLREERDRERSFGTKAGSYTRGHTSFLTFAVLLPLVDGLSQPISQLIVNGGSDKGEE